MPATLHIHRHIDLPCNKCRNEGDFLIYLKQRGKLMAIGRKLLSQATSGSAVCPQINPDTYSSNL